MILRVKLVLDSLSYSCIYIFFLTPPSLISSGPINFFFSYNNMSQYNFNQILLQIKQQYEQIAILQILLVARKGAGEEDGVEVTDSRPNTRSNVDMAKPPTFNRDTIKVLDFITVYRLYIRIKMKDNLIEEQI